jgi:hypothetical protein
MSSILISKLLTMKTSYSPLVITTVLFASFVVTFSSCTNDHHHADSKYVPGLAVQMKQMSYWTHKLGLSIEAENDRLTDFYHHELEEATEYLVETKAEYKGLPIAELIDAMMAPVVEDLEVALETGDWSGVRMSYNMLIQSCNSCHAATGYGMIIVSSGFGNNPFNMNFEKQ